MDPIQSIRTRMTDEDVRLLSDIYAPTEAATPDGDARSNLTLLRDGRIRFYGHYGKKHVYDTASDRTHGALLVSSFEKNGRSDMNKFFSILLVFVLLFAFVSCGQDATDVPLGMKLASNPEIVNYTLYVPEDWMVSSSTGMTMVQASYTDPTNLIVTHHSHQSLNEYADAKNMLIAYLYGEDEVKLSDSEGEKTYREYDESLLQKDGGYLNRVYEMFDTEKDADGNEKSTFTMIEEPSFMTLNKGDKAVVAISFMYTATLDGAQLQQKMILSYEDAYYYNFTFTTAPGLYDTHLTTFNSILENFSFDD